MTSCPRRELGRRALRPLLLASVLAAGGVPGAAGGPGTGSGGRPVRIPTSPAIFVAPGQTSAAAAGQVTAHDGKFWLGAQQIKLRGVNVVPNWERTFPTDADFVKIASWGMNFVRLQIRWRFVEPTAPVKSGSNWTHAYNSTWMAAIKDQIGWAYDHGIYTLVDNAGHSGPPSTGGSYWWPEWLYSSPYNSHRKNYTSGNEANTDYWTDSLQQQFTREFWSYVADQLKGTPGVMGYEIINEPQRGTLSNSHQTTETMLGVSLSIAQAVRLADPSRVVVFMTRGCCGEGLLQADLSGFTALGNVAFDFHDYFGSRWGVGVLDDPSDPEYGEVLQVLGRFTLDTGPYLGTTTNHVRAIQNYQEKLSPTGIPLMVAEFSGDPPLEPNEANLMGTMTSAFNQEGVSWALYSYLDGPWSIVKSDGTLQPWAWIVIDAAKAP